MLPSPGLPPNSEAHVWVLISYLCVLNSALSASGFLQFFGVCSSIAPVKKFVELGKTENSIAPPASGKWW